MPRYKVKRPYIAKNGELIEPGHILNEFHNGKFLEGLLKHDFVKEIKEKVPEFKPMLYSELANVEIADQDYTEGDKKHFTYGEALEVEKKLQDGWRLPTRSELALICEEYGQNERGELAPDVLMNHLNLGMHGYMDIDGYLRLAGRNGGYWSSTARSSASNAYNLWFYPTGVYPSDYNSRYFGFSLRFVRDRK